MTTFYTVAARLSGIAAVVCAALALLTSPAVSRADDLSECYDQCAAAYGAGTPDFITCTGGCGIQGAGCSNAGCSKTCIGSLPLCGNGDCSKKAACVTAGCTCQILILGNYKGCECRV